MTAVHGAIVSVGLSLDHANTIVELVRDGIYLVTGCISFNVEGRVVRADFGNVAVFAVAEFGVIVAWLSVGS